MRRVRLVRKWVARHRGLVAAILGVALSLVSGPMPRAYATVNGGPWDTATYYWNTCSFFSSGICNNNSNGFERGFTWASIDSDDYSSYNDASPEYVICAQLVGRSSSPGTVYGSVPLKKTATSSGGATPSPTTQSGYLFATWYGGMFGGDYDVTGTRVTSASTTCNSAVFGGTPSAGTRPLLAYSGTVYDPVATHIRNAGDFLNTSGSAPWFSDSTDSATTRPPSIAQSGGSISTDSLPTTSPTVNPSAGNNIWSATIAVNPSPSSPRTGETYTYDIDWGDGSTHATTASSQHTYANNTQQTAVVKLTSTLTNGDQYTDATTTHVVTQNESVCWNASCPLPTTTTTVAANGDNGTGSSSCDFWDVPCQLARIFRSLFVPNSSTTNGIAHLWDSVTTKAPFSVLYEVVTFIPSNLADMSAAITNPVAGVGTGCGPQPVIDGHTVTHFPCNDVTTGQPARYTINGDTSTNGGGITSGAYSSNLFREIFLLIAGLLFVYACYRGCAEILK